MQWYLYVLKHYALFDGRASRTEFWMFTLINFLVGIAGFLISLIGLGIIYGLYSLAVIIPTLALQIRRLHDTNRSGWWILLGLIPAVGSIILLIFDLLPGDAEPNDYGPVPPVEVP